MSYKASSSGEYDRYIQIKSKTRTQNEFGEETITLALFAEAWAKKRSNAGKEFFAGAAGKDGSKIAEETMMYTFRYLPDLTHDMVIIDGSEQFDITRISELGRGIETQVIAKTRAL